MDWFIPITIIPGIGMLVLSTTNQMMALSGEIERLLIGQCDDFQHHIASLKIDQLKLLTTAGTLFYLAAAFYVLSGIIAAIFSPKYISEWTLYMGVAVTFLALAILTTYSYRAIKIRKSQHRHNLIKQNKNGK